MGKSLLRTEGSDNLAGYIDHFTTRVLADAMAEASATHWRRRAAVFEAAAPRREEFHGQASDAELSASWQRCMASAEACRRRADLIDSAPEIDPEVVAEVEAMLRAVVEVRAAAAEAVAA